MYYVLLYSIVYLLRTMDAESYLNHINKDLKEFQDLSVEELTRDQTGKTDFYENIQKMQEQTRAIQYILDNIAAEKNTLDYGLNHKVDDMKINTLKYIVEHLLERVHVAELLQNSK